MSTTVPAIFNVQLSATQAADREGGVTVRPSPLGISELLDQYIGLLHESTSDLAACALVSRSWVPAAQSRIFKSLSITAPSTAQNTRLWSRCQATLRGSPHLIRYIHSLSVSSTSMLYDTFAAVCTYPFTHLRKIFVVIGFEVVLLQHMFSLPTLRSAECIFITPANWLPILGHCSPALKHLSVMQCQSSPETLDPSSYQFSTPFQLKSLCIRCAEISDWLSPAGLPLDFSSLRFLSIGTTTEIINGPTLAPILRHIEVLDFVAIKSQAVINLSLFHNLVMLRVSLDMKNGWSEHLPTLSTITSLNRIRTIWVRGLWKPAGPFLSQLDSTLAGLQTPHLNLETDVWQYRSMSTHLPRLISQKRLHRTDEHSWEEIVNHWQFSNSSDNVALM
ncbi:hypothetical protein B0H14DRAFT_2701289 [Mycena olivaceomarginata]|nr:hypothetical protein B0H14DRAFT_2701289 [Mycena olivaceomarginata]